MRENICITFELPDNINLSNAYIKNIDNYLTNFFLINIEDLVKKDINTKTIIQRILKLTITFLQAIKIPIFSEGLIELLEHNKKREKLEIIVSFTCID